MRRTRSGTSAAVTWLLVIAASGSLSACSSTGEPGTPAASQTPAHSETAAAATTTGDPHFVRAKPGDKPDVRISNLVSSGRWTGPWPNDLSGLSLTHGQASVVVELEFSRLALEEGSRRGDEILVWLDAPGRRGVPGGRTYLEPERGLFVAWGLPLRLLKKPCEDKPELEQGDLTITLRVRRSCVDDLERVRAQAFVTSYRTYDSLPAGQRSWRGDDETAWTDFADLGDTVAVDDPAH